MIDAPTESPAATTIQAPAALKAAVRAFWDRQPCGLKNATAAPGTRAFYEQIEAHRYREEFHIPLVAEFGGHAGQRVLEVACGLGTDGRQFARGGARYVGCDLSLASLALARRGFAHFDLPGGFSGADAERLPFADESVDVVYSHGALHHTPDTAQAVQEVHRVLRTGGTAIIMLYARESALYLGAQVLGRLRLERERRRLGVESFNALVGLAPGYRGWLPDWVVVNNSTDGVGNPLSRLYRRDELQRLFGAFRNVRLEKHYFPRRKLPVVGPRLPRGAALWLGRLAGGFWYVKAVK
jgi:SAM-dependent methyltransferase